MANSNNWGEIYKSTWWGGKAWSANTLFIDSAPPGFGLNLLKASEDMDNTLDWKQVLSSVVANSTDEAAPNSTDTAEKITFTADRQSRIQQQIALEANTTYTFSVYAKVRTGTKAFRLRNSTLGQAQQFTADTSWGLNPDDGRYSFSFTTGATAITHTLSIQNAAAGGSGEVFFWGAMLNEGATAGDYVKTDASFGGSSPSAEYTGFGDEFAGVTAYYSLRQFTEAETLNAIRVRRSSDDTEQDIGFDANGDLDTTALTTFVGTQNLIFPSEDFGGASWTKQTGITATSNTSETTDPLGGSAAAKIVSTDATKGFFISGLSFPTSSDLIRSIYLKGAVGGETAVLKDPSGYGGSTAVTLTTEWQRFTHSTSAGVTDAQGIFVDDISVGTIYAFGAQCNEGTTATTYNKTTTGIGGDGAVTTFYDQTGNGNDATNSTASEQPLVVSGGTLVTENGKAAIEFDGVSNNLGVSLRLTHYPLAAMAVQKWNSTAGGQMSILLSEVAGGQIYFPWNQSSGTFSYRYGDGSNNIAYNKTATTNQILSSLSVGASGGSFKENNVQVGSAISVPSAARLSTADITLGAYTSSSLFADVFIQELIIFDSDQSSNRTGIETNINDHFDIYTP